MTRLEAQTKGEALARQATTAVVTALPIEQAAMEAMLDSPLPFSTAGNAPGEYVVGTIPSNDGHQHIVILARCDVAENLSATNATILFERFPQLDRVLVVGIAGAAPDPTKPENDVHLGDVIVCNEAGVIQYDYEKEILRGDAELTRIAWKKIQAIDLRS
jgi:nucleoside phosphorylase